MGQTIISVHINQTENCEISWHADGLYCCGQQLQLGLFRDQVVCGVGSFCTLLVLDVEITFTVPKLRPQHTTHPQIPTVLSYKMSPLTETFQSLCAFFFHCCNEQLCSEQKIERSLFFPPMTRSLVLNLKETSINQILPPSLLAAVGHLLQLHL